ncbi:MAG: hypothetical protein RL318_1010, partial [Fibrobacterota bacterium]
MLNWQWISNEAFEPNPEDVLLVLGQDGCPSGELLGDRYALLRESIAASLLAQKDRRIDGGEWVGLGSDGARAWVLGVGPKPGHDAEERLKIAAGEAFAIAMKRKPARIVML